MGEFMKQRGAVVFLNSRGCICWHSYQKHPLLKNQGHVSSGTDLKGAKSHYFTFDFIAPTGESKETQFH